MGYVSAYRLVFTVFGSMASAAREPATPFEATGFHPSAPGEMSWWIREVDDGNQSHYPPVNLTV